MNKTIATVDALGMVKAIAKGKTTITVTTQNMGKTANCTIVVLDNPTNIETLNDKNIIIYPNPVSDKLTVIHSGESSQIVLYSIDGLQLLNTTSVNSPIEIDMAKYNSGLYVLKVMSFDKELIYKILKK